MTIWFLQVTNIGMTEPRIEIGDQLVIVPFEPMDCTKDCPERREGCSTGPLMLVEVTSMQIAPVRAPRVTPIGAVCMAGVTAEQPPASPQA